MAQEPEVDLRTFVTRQYYHGVPYTEARSYGSAAVPDLVAMLDDASLAEHWTTIIGTMAYIGDPAAVDPLLAFLGRLKGEVSAEAFRAAISVPQALGHLAQGGDDRAMAALEAFAREEYAQATGLDFWYRRYRGAALDEVLGRMAILGLGISGLPEALDLLNAMRAAAKTGGLRADWTDNLEEAVQLNQTIQSEGAVRVFGRRDP